MGDEPDAWLYGLPQLVEQWGHTAKILQAHPDPRLRAVGRLAAEFSRAGLLALEGRCEACVRAAAVGAAVVDAARRPGAN